MTALPKLTLRSVRVRGVDVPMRRPLQTGGGLVRTAPLVLIDLETEEGVTGRSYIFCYTPLTLQPTVALLHNLEEIIRGDPVAPVALERKLQGRFRLLGAAGLAGMAMAGLDMAAWDALARAVELPLVRLLGGDPRPIRAYNSCGLGLIGPERVGDEARALAAPGFGAIKLRLGYPDMKSDLAAIRAVREAVGSDIRLMTDYNQCLSAGEALARGAALDGEGLYWIEEPISADDNAGYAYLRSQLKTPIQMGENWWGTHEMAKSLAAGAADYVMPDAMKIGGVTGWLRAAALAEAHGLPVSCHLFPEISVHLLAVTPTCHWLEYVDWAEPILAEPLQFKDGHALISPVPGIGLTWDEAAVERYAVV